MSKAGLMPSPVCLVENVNGSLNVCKDAIEYLSRINEPVVVVSGGTLPYGEILPYEPPGGTTVR